MLLKNNLRRIPTTKPATLRAQPGRAHSLRLSRCISVQTAIEYPDGKPHIGHVYEKVLADIQARYHRSNGHRVSLSVGLDEHSKKVVHAAQLAGQSPRDFCDGLEGVYRDTWRRFNISADVFVRTSQREHFATVQTILKRLHQNGDIYRDKYQHALCPQCGPEKKPHLRAGICREHNVAVTTWEEDSYFFNISRHLQTILDHVESHPEFIQPESYRAVVLNQLRQQVTKPAANLSISRPNNAWGIPLGFDETDVLARQSVAYVWVDALCNYLTVAGFGHDTNRFAQFWPTDLHVIGKDILRHHAVLWPAFLLSAGLPLPKKLLVHGFILNANGIKVSKSNGDGTKTIDDALIYGIDPLRYYLARQINPAKDETFTLKRLQEVHESELVRRFDGILSWLEILTKTHFDGRIPSGPALEPYNDFLKILERYESAMNADDSHAGALRLVELFGFLSRFVGERAQHTKLKDAYAENADIQLRTALELFRLTALALWPFMPQTIETALNRIGIDQPILSEDPLIKRKWHGAWTPNHSLTPGGSLFSL